MEHKKNRHGCLTAWLVIMIIVNAGTALLYMFGSEDISLGLPMWVTLTLAAFGIFNLVCAIALFQWKKWGFWGFIGSSIVMLFINLSIGVGIGSSLSGLVGVVLMYGVLQIGDENKGWPQLE